MPGIFMFPMPYPASLDGGVSLVLGASVMREMGRTMLDPSAEVGLDGSFFASRTVGAVAQPESKITTPSGKAWRKDLGISG